MAQPLDPLSPALPPRPPLRHRVPGQRPRRHDDTEHHDDEDVRDHEREDSRETHRENSPDAGDLTYDDRIHGPPGVDDTDAPGRPGGDAPLIDDYA